MAGNMQINIKDRDSATAWLNKVEQTNEKYHNAMRDAGECLSTMSDFCDGTIVDEIVKYGTTMMNAAQKTFEGLSLISGTVNKILDTVTNFTENVVGALGSILGKGFNSK